MRSFLLLIILGISTLAFSQKKTTSASLPIKSNALDTLVVTDTIIITTGDTPFREKPDINSKEIKTIPGYVELKSFIIIGKYYQVTINEITGYIPIAFVRKKVPDVSIENSTPTNTPPHSYKTSSKGCSTVQCSGQTQKRAQCRNRTTNCSGRCYLH